MPELRQQRDSACASALHGDHRQEELAARVVMPISGPDGDDWVPKPLKPWIGQLLCWIGIHDLRVIEVIAGFGVGGQVQRVECRRCGRIMTR